MAFVRGSGGRYLQHDQTISQPFSVLSCMSRKREVLLLEKWGRICTSGEVGVEALLLSRSCLAMWTVLSTCLS